MLEAIGGDARIAMEDIGHQHREAALRQPLGDADIGGPDAPDVGQEHDAREIGDVVGTEEKRFGGNAGDFNFCLDHFLSS